MREEWKLAYIPTERIIMPQSGNNKYMINKKDILIGLSGGAVGGAVVDLIFISFVGPSFLLSLILGLTERYQVFLGHLFLGGIFGILFILVLNKLARFNLNVWVCGILWGLVSMGVLGGIPSLFVQYPISVTMTLFSFMVWLIYGSTLAAAVKFFK